MNVVDSSGWLEYFADGPNADFFANAIENTSDLVVPTISIYEVFKRVIQQRDESAALLVAVDMQQGLIVDLDITLAMEAAKLSSELKLPLAGSIMLTTARVYNATLWSQDADFMGIDGVQYTKKK